MKIDNFIESSIREEQKEQNLSDKEFDKIFSKIEKEIASHERKSFRFNFKIPVFMSDIMQAAVIILILILIPSAAVQYNKLLNRQQGRAGGSVIENVGPSNPNPETNEGDVINSEGNTVYRAFFNKNKDVYVFDGLTGEIRPFAYGSINEMTKKMSPQGKNVAVYRYRSNEELIPIIEIYSIEAAKVGELVINNEYGRQMSSFSWLNEEIILIEGHVNPSASGYVLYDVRTGQEINYCVGQFYQLLSDEKTMLFQLSPHFTEDQKANLALQLKDDVVNIYEAEDSEEIIYNAAISKDLTKIAIYSEGSGNERYVSIGDFNFAEGRIHNLARHSVERDSWGKIVFEGSEIVLKNKEFIYTFNGKGFIKSQAEVQEETEESGQEVKTKLQEAARKYFNEGNPRIEDITWFASKID
jgi:hypothetical protein